jgi:hypothetical protein
MTLKERIEQWEKSPFDESTIAEVDTLRQNPTELEDAFYTDVAFGTGGMRGIMGAGTNRINRYTLGKASQGLADYLNARFKNIAPVTLLRKLSPKYFQPIILIPIFFPPYALPLFSPMPYVS